MDLKLSSEQIKILYIFKFFDTKHIKGIFLI